MLKLVAKAALLFCLFQPILGWAYIGGKPSNGDIRSSVGIVTDNVLCTGVKVDTRKILTARHCVSGVLEIGDQIELLTQQGYSPGARTQVGTVTKIWTAPVDGSRSDWAPDMAVFEVNVDLRLWSTAKISYKDVRPTEKLWVGGHGCKGINVGNQNVTYTGDYKKPFPESNPGEVEFDSRSAQSYGNSFSCSGDSGGPVIRRFAGNEIVVGVNKSVRYNQDEFRVNSTTGEITQLPNVTHTRPLRFTAEKIYSESNELIHWLEKILPYSTFTWD
jgi:hypothetical protein